MLIRIKTSADIPSSEITPEHVYRSRRDFIRVAAAGAVGAVAGTVLSGGGGGVDAQASLAALPNAKRNSAFVVDETVDPLTSYEQITTYNNYYEFGTRKSQPAQNAHILKVRPWTVKVDGLVNKPGDYGLEDLVDFNQLEERVYRHRCVEAWSMVMPFIGVPLSSVLKRVEPRPSATFVEFTTVFRQSEMPLWERAGIELPYIEGLRMDEALHPLTLMAVGLYGKVLPNQCGAPLRVHIPWKYGFKSGKSIVRIRLTDKQPLNTWQLQRADEYGFYANVNPTVPHPRWPQDREQRLPSPFKERKTLMFNGYADQVASLYSGMDLKKFY